MWHKLALPVLAPLLLVQGRQVQRDTPQLPEARGEREGVFGNGPLLRLLILGDSSAAGVGAATQQDALAGQLVGALSGHFETHWQLLATTGHTTRDGIQRLAALEHARFDVAVTVFGVNDVTSMLRTEQFLQQQAALRERLRAQCEVARIIVNALPPMGEFPALPHPLRWFLGQRAARFNAALQAELAADPHADFLAMELDNEPADMASDGFHPGPAIYAQWAKKLADLIV